MADLGPTINIMYAPIYYEFKSHILHFDDILVHLLDLSLVMPLGLVRDVLVKVNDFLFFADFYVIDVNVSSPPFELSILLGKPFLETMKVVINMDKGSLIE